MCGINARWFYPRMFFFAFQRFNAIKMLHKLHAHSSVLINELPVHQGKTKLCSVAIDCPIRWIFNQQKKIRIVRLTHKKAEQKIFSYRILCAFQNKGACYWHATVFGTENATTFISVICFWLINTQVTTTMATAMVAPVDGYCSTDPIKLLKKYRFQHYHYTEIDTKTRGDEWISKMEFYSSEWISLVMDHCSPIRSCLNPKWILIDSYALLRPLKNVWHYFNCVIKKRFLIPNV